MIERRGVLLGLGSLLAAPAIIRTPGLLMPVVRPWEVTDIHLHALQFRGDNVPPPMPIPLALRIWSTRKGIDPNAWVHTVTEANTYHDLVGYAYEARILTRV